MNNDRHDEDMFGFILLALILVAGPLAFVAGADSRIDEHARRPRYND
jgi:hypothetical protein